MTVFIGTSGGNRTLTDPKVGDTGVRRDVAGIWVGDSGGVPRLVYQRIPPLALAAAPVSSSQIDVSWTDLGPGFAYQLWNDRSANPLYVGAWGPVFPNTGLPAGTAVGYRVDAYSGGVLRQQAWAAATTLPSVGVQRVWTGNAVQSASYNASGGNRGVGECYYGYYSGTHGMQKSLARWEIPAEIRGCISVDRVELSWWNLHHYLNSGGRVSLVHHDFHGSLAGSYPAANVTAPLRNPQAAGDPVVEWAAPKPGWINGSEWFDVGWLHAANQDGVGDEIRVGGLAGFGLVALTTDPTRYGYARGAGGPIQLRVTYTVAGGD